MANQLELLLIHALRQPTDAVAYQVMLELTALYPKKNILYTSECSFKPEQFEEDGKCQIETIKPGLLSLIETEWWANKQNLKHKIKDGWQKVTWEGHTFEMMILSWTQGYSTERNFWIISETSEVAEQFLITVCKWCEETHSEVLVFENGDWYKSDELYTAIKNASFDNLILPHGIKQEIQDDFKQFFDSREIYEKYKIPWKRGVLLIGPPGNGKTHTVKALINWLDKPCLYVKSIKTHYGTPQSNLYKVFQRARETTPCIIVMEDLDSMIDNECRSFFLNEIGRAHV